MRGGGEAQELMLATRKSNVDNRVLVRRLARVLAGSGVGCIPTVIPLTAGVLRRRRLSANGRFRSSALAILRRSISSDSGVHS